MLALDILKIVAEALFSSQAHDEEYFRVYDPRAGNGMGMKPSDLIIMPSRLCLRNSNLQMGIEICQIKFLMVDQSN